MLYELGLIPAIRWKLEQIEKKHKIKTIIIGENVQLDIKKEFDIFIYRIVSELFTNVVKHAQASLIELEISNDSESYFIVVRDNGVGFKKRNSKKEKENIRYGLMSITERIESIKGSFEIESKPGMGAEAKIIIPISQE
ncbi:MAG: hypothetical protein KAI79_20315 [Bacteroidales bacterium]|nr:hypothetical protein [Bacteroidales bacterium]